MNPFTTISIDENIELKEKNFFIKKYISKEE